MNNTSKSTSVYIINDRLVVGGVAIIIQMISHNLNINGYLCRVFINDERNLIKNMEGFNAIGFGLNGLRKILTLLASPFPISLILKILKDRFKNRRSVIHLNTPYLPTAISAIFASLLTRTSFIYTVHANRSHISNLYWLVEKILFYYSSFFVLELRSSLIDYKSYSQRKIKFIAFGVDKDKVQHKWNLQKNDNFIFVAINRLDKNRMVDVFIKAFAIQAKENNSLLNIIGDGDNRGYLVKMVFDLNLQHRVNFFHSISELEIQDVLATSDCFLTLSARGDVGMTGKLAAGVGIPILAYEFDGSEDHFYTATSINHLSEKMKLISKSGDDKLIEYANKTSELLYTDSQLMIEKYFSIYGLDKK